MSVNVAQVSYYVAFRKPEVRKEKEKTPEEEISYDDATTTAQVGEKKLRSVQLKKSN